MRTVVIIEDQTVLATAYCNKFKGEGFNVEVAHDGQDGLDLITRIKPDLVLLDLMLPKMSGLDVLKRVRANPNLRSLPIIVLSSLAKPAATEEAWQAGATLVLSKFNTSPRRVLESVQSTLAANFSPEPLDLPPIETRPKASLETRSAKNDQGKGNVLLVEPNSDLNSLMGFLLRQAGHQVTGVGRKAEALEQISAQGFDFILLSRNGPEIDGISFCTHLRKSGLNKPIIIYSTAALFSEQQEGLRAGATAYLVKPEDLFNVGQIVSDLLTSQSIRPSIRAA